MLIRSLDIGQTEPDTGKGRDAGGDRVHIKVEEEEHTVQAMDSSIEDSVEAEGQGGAAAGSQRQEQAQAQVAGLDALDNAGGQDAGEIEDVNEGAAGADLFHETTDEGEVGDVGEEVTASVEDGTGDDEAPGPLLSEIQSLSAVIGVGEAADGYDDEQDPATRRFMTQVGSPLAMSLRSVRSVSSQLLGWEEDDLHVARVMPHAIRINPAKAGQRAQRHRTAARRRIS